MTDFLLEGGVLPDGKMAQVLIKNGLISQIDPVVSTLGATNLQRVNIDGCIILPGFVDLHTHLREPGREDSETVESGSRAAAKGGFTAVSAMANTFPVADTAGVVEQVYALGQATGLCDVFPIGAVTQGLNGTALAELGAMADSTCFPRPTSMSSTSTIPSSPSRPR